MKKSKNVFTNPFVIIVVVVAVVLIFTLILKPKKFKLEVEILNKAPIENSKNYNLE